MFEKIAIDIISDLHLDMYTNSFSSFTGNSIESIDRFTDKFFTRKGDVLILAGDITHANHELPKLFTNLGEKYKKILVIPGNHDFYLIKHYMSKDEEYSEDRYQNLLKACNNTEGKVVLLNCDYHTYEGITFFGMMGWYDGLYAKKHFNYTEANVNNLYRAVMNDSRLIKFRDDDNTNMFNRSARERIKMENLGVLRKADVFISHCVPSLDKRLIHPDFRDEVSTCFYTFDGAEYIRQIDPKLVIHGHTHRPMVNNYEGRTYIVNPLGYPHENINVHGPHRVHIDRKELVLNQVSVVSEGEK